MEPEDTPEQAISDQVARMDQALANVRDLAAMVAVYYRSLVENGFDPQSALVLTLAYQQAVTAKGAPDA